MSEILVTIARVRRAMPRNTDVMAICDALEKELVSNTFEGERREMARIRADLAPRPKLTRAQIQKRYRERRKAEEKK